MARQRVAIGQRVASRATTANRRAVWRSAWSPVPGGTVTACPVSTTVLFVAQFAADLIHVSLQNGEGSLHDQYLRACMLAIATAKKALCMPEQHAYFTTAVRYCLSDFTEVAFSEAVASLAWVKDVLGASVPWHYHEERERACLAILPPRLRASAMQWYAARTYSRIADTPSPTQAIADAIADYWATVDGEPAMALASLTQAIEARQAVWDRMTRVTSRSVPCSWGSRSSHIKTRVDILAAPNSSCPGDVGPVRMSDLETNPRACLGVIDDARQRLQDIMAAVRRDIAIMLDVNIDWDKAFARWKRVLQNRSLGAS